MITETKTPRILAIIPARGGSKGIPRKNLHLVNNKPMLYYTIKSALHSEHITHTVISSDDTEILEYSKKFCDTVTRPLHLADDNSTIESVIHFTIDYIRERSNPYDFVVILQPTSPLRTSKDIDRAIELYLSSEATALVSVYEGEKTPLRSFKQNSEGYLEGIVSNDYPFINRQDIPDPYISNGAIYIINTEIFMQSGKIYTDKTIPFIMPKLNSVDVDTLDDIKKVEEQLLKK